MLLSITLDNYIYYYMPSPLDIGRRSVCKVGAIKTEKNIELSFIPFGKKAMLMCVVVEWNGVLSLLIYCCFNNGALVQGNFQQKADCYRTTLP